MQGGEAAGVSRLCTSKGGGPSSTPSELAEVRARSPPSPRWARHGALVLTGGCTADAVLNAWGAGAWLHFLPTRTKDDLDAQSQARQASHKPSKACGLLSRGITNWRDDSRDAMCEVSQQHHHESEGDENQRAYALVCSCCVQRVCSKCALMLVYGVRANYCGGH